MHCKQIRRPVEFEEWISTPLPGRYKIGDRVICCIERVFDNGDRVSIGDEGTVLGLDYGDEPSVSTANRYVQCIFPQKKSSINMHGKQIRRPEQTMVLKTVRPVQRLLLAAMTLRTMQDSSNDQSAVQVRL